RSRPMLGHLREMQRRIKAHNVVVASAGVAFYGLLALVPTLIALVSIYGLVADPADIEQQVADIAGELDEGTRDLLVNQLQDIVGAEEAEGEGGGSVFGRWFALIFGIALALWSSSGAVQKLIGTVAVAYEAEEGRAGWKVRGMAYLFTAGAIIGIGLMILVIGVMPNLLSRVDLGGLAETAIAIGQYPVLAILFAGALTILYRYGPDRDPRTPWRNPGAIVATVLFLVFAIAFSIYSANVGAMPASYGLLGSIAALMIFLQLTTIAVIAGAETNSMVEEARAEELAAMATVAGGGTGSTVRANGAGSSTNGAAAPDLSLGKALAGLAALFVLGRSND
ncbi:MAG: YihY/virulence factor BrkB family protein, partial [Actinomycetota bacterium]